MHKYFFTTQFIFLKKSGICTFGNRKLHFNFKLDMQVFLYKFDLKLILKIKY